MLLLRCPYCEEDCPEVEFRYAGEANLVRPADPSAASDEEWTAYLFRRKNPRGLHAERWRHVHGCGAFFNAVRDTVSDEFVTTWPSGQRPPAGIVE
jgi:sarcosine oxidase subunit delta